jgi:hypothetical protein
MRLIEVQVRDKVPTGAPGDNTARLQSIAGSGPSQGWELAYEAGMVTARKLDMTLLIPVGNVAYMRPEIVVADVKKGKAA